MTLGKYKAFLGWGSWNPGVCGRARCRPFVHRLSQYL
jgi:hypothetical protein